MGRMRETPRSKNLPAAPSGDRHGRWRKGGEVSVEGWRCHGVVGSWRLEGVS